MFGIDALWLAAAVLGGGIVLLGVSAFLLQAGCALADVPGRGYFPSLGISLAAIVICLPLTCIIVWFAGRYNTDPHAWFGGARIVGLIGSLLLTWLLAAGIYALFLTASIRKGLIVSGVELLLLGLLAALIAAVVLVVLALVQILRQPSPVKTSRAEHPALRIAAASRS
jgi:hypothetical protein